MSGSESSPPCSTADELAAQGRQKVRISGLATPALQNILQATRMRLECTSGREALASRSTPKTDIRKPLDPGSTLSRPRRRRKASHSACIQPAQISSSSSFTKESVKSWHHKITYKKHSPADRIHFQPACGSRRNDRV